MLPGQQRRRQPLPALNPSGPVTGPTEATWLPAVHQVVFYVLVCVLAWAPLPRGSNSLWAIPLLACMLCALLAVLVGSAWLAGAPLLAPVGQRQATGRPGVAALWPMGLLAGFTVLVAAQWLAPGGHTADPFSTRVYLVQCLTYAAAFSLVVLLVRDEARLRLLVGVMVVSGVLQALFATVSLSQPGGFDFLFMRFDAGQGQRATGTLTNPDHLAFFLALALSLGLGLILGGTAGGQAPRGWRAHVVALLEFVLSRKMLVRLLLVMMVVALVLTRSRAGNGNFFIALMLIGLLVAWRSRQLRRSALILAASMLVVDLLVIGQWVGLDKVVQRLEGTRVTMESAQEAQQTAVARGRSADVYREESLEERLFAAQYTLQMIGQRPWFGHGGGSFAVAFPPFKGEHPLGFYDHTHNDYAEIAADTGLLGLGLLLTLGALALRRAVQGLNDNTTPFARGVAAGLCMAMLYGAMHMFVDFNLQIPVNALYFTVVLAMAWCLPEPRPTRSRSSGSARSGGAAGNA